MQKFKQLLQYLTQQNLVADENLEAYVANNTLQLSGSRDTEKSLVAAHKTYQGVYEFEAYQGNADRLLAHVAAWLSRNEQSDVNEDMPPPNFEIEMVDAHTVDVLIEIEFGEKLTLEKDPEGEFEFYNQRYRLAPVQIDIATEIDMQIEVGQ